MSKSSENNQQTPLGNFFDFAFESDGQPTEGKPKKKVALKDLVYNDELIQDDAPKQYYTNVNVKDKTQRMVMEGCILSSRKIKPVIAIIFVIVYWGAGLWRSAQIE